MINSPNLLYASNPRTSSGRLSILLGALWLTITAAPAWATPGYFSLAYGARSMGMAGAVVARPQDALAAAANPAGMAQVGERTDIGLLLFNPVRRAELDPRAVGGSFVVGAKSDRNFFPVPEFGLTRRLKDTVWAGLSVYGNGGMNTTYRRNIYDETSAVLGAFQAGGAAAAAAVPEGTQTGTPDTGTLGVDLAQLIIAPTLAIEFKARQWLGASLLIGIQRFAARGLGNFQCFTQTGATHPANVASNACGPGGQQALTPGFVPSEHLTDNGHDIAYGAGLRLGWLGVLGERLTVGASVASKIYMTEFDRYKELFAEGGDFDIPANYAVGAAFQATPALTVALDYQRTRHSGVRAINNPGPAPGPAIPPGSGLLGTDNGLGYGWQDIDIVRLGVVYHHGPRWTFRGGLAYNDSPIPDDELLFNITAPGVIRRHATIGFTHRPREGRELTFAYMRGFNARQESPQTAFGIPGAIEMYQNAFDISYAWTY